jgi:hypothetical protein
MFPVEYLGMDETFTFVEPGFTEVEQSAEAAYWERMRAIDQAADAQVAELEAEALLCAHDDDLSPYAGNWSEE